MTDQIKKVVNDIEQRLMELDDGEAMTALTWAAAREIVMRCGPGVLDTVKFFDKQLRLAVQMQGGELVSESQRVVKH